MGFVEAFYRLMTIEILNDYVFFGFNSFQSIMLCSLKYFRRLSGIDIEDIFDGNYFPGEIH